MMGKKDRTPEDAQGSSALEPVGEAEARGRTRGTEAAAGKSRKGDQGDEGGTAAKGDKKDKQGKKDKKDKGGKGKERREELGRAATPSNPGPLAPWKFAIAVGMSAAFTGGALFDAAMSGVGLDAALLRSFAVAFGVWMAVGIVNSVLRQAQESVERDRAERERAEREARERELAALDELGEFGASQRP